MGQSDRNRKWEDGGLTELSYDGRPRRKTFGSVASLATGLTSAPTDMLYCFSGFVVLTQIFDVINFFFQMGKHYKQTETYNKHYM